MLLVEPNPFYLLLEETEVAAGATAAVGARLTVHLERDFFVIGGDSNTTLAQEAENVVLHKHVGIVEQGERVELADGIVGGLEELKHGVVEQTDVVVKQHVHLLRVIELLGDRTLHCLQNLVTQETVWTKPLIYGHNLI